MMESSGSRVAAFCGYRNYLLFFLTAIIAFSYLDRMLFGIALQDIKADLKLSDSDLGILTGTVFAIFFAIAGIPIGRWADRGNRVVIVALTTGIWSVSVALCAFAGNFTHLALLRIGTATGEAGCNPPAHSLLPEYFERAERPRAMSRYWLGTPIGVMMGLFVGGWLNQLYGWRVAFVAVGAPGVPLAILALLTLKEPRKSPASTTLAESEVAPPLMAVIRQLATNATFRHMLFYLLFIFLGSWGLVQWLPAFFVRAHHMATGELGTWLALVNGCGGLAGTWLGGEWASRYAANNERLQLRAIAPVVMLYGVFNAVALLLPNPYWSLAVLALAAVAIFAVNGPVFATLQTLVPARMRATALTLVVTLPLFVGMGLGPSTAGVLSDWFAVWAGGNSLRYALLAIIPAVFWSAAHLVYASRTVERDIAALQAQ